MRTRFSRSAARRTRCCTTICARWCWSGTAMVGVDTASIRGSSTFRHCGFRPRLSAPYRAQTKGKVERFIRYLRESFWVPLSSRLTQEGLIVDRETANLAVKLWLREVANVRIHGTTGAIPAERLVSERLQLQSVPTPYGGRTVRAMQTTPEPVRIIGMQHPLSLYDAFAGGAR